MEKLPIGTHSQKKSGLFKEQVGVWEEAKKASARICLRRIGFDGFTAGGKIHIRKKKEGGNQ